MDRLTNIPDPGLWLSSDHWEQMRADVTRRAPEEACGLLAGQNNHIFQVFPVTNQLHNQVRFRMDPEEQLKAFRHIEDQGWELLGIYHSHPNGPEEPSMTDIAEAYYPEAIHLIWSQKAGQWICKGFRIQGESITKVSVSLVTTK